MLIIYDINNGYVISISGFRTGPISKELIDGIQLINPLPEGKAELRIYDSTIINKIWEACNKHATINIALDKNGNPIGVMADGKMIV